MKLLYVTTVTSILLLTGCAIPQKSSVSVDVKTTTSNLEELPANVNLENLELPEIEPLTTSSDALIGSWKTLCLVPDENSNYAEQHYFEIYPNRTATHTRESFYKKTCSGGSDMTLVHNYNYTIPTAGQINFTDLDTDLTFYDIYMVQNGSLTFGHGFRNTLPYPASLGGSEADRIPTLNQYIIYTQVK